MPPLIYSIFREKALSPGKVEMDGAILEEVLQHLAAWGCEVRFLAAEEIPAAPPAAMGVLHMAQGPKALRRLGRWQESGLPLVNSPAAVLACYRRDLFPFLARHRFPCPHTRFFSLDEARSRWPQEFPGPGWLKRAEIHAEGPGDVVQVATLAEALEVLVDFGRRHIKSLVWQEHVPGQEIKFYAVGPGRFFQAFWTATDAMVTEPMLSSLQDLASPVARRLGLAVFGGDVILTPEGHLVLIDLNDWPSFCRCRPAAAQEIAHYVEDLWQL
jgi:glutathione synthase/RimK-type ligase-like ATP-grasp enzyme